MRGTLLASLFPMRDRLAAAFVAGCLAFVAAKPAQAEEPATELQSPAALGIGIFLSSVGTAGLITGGYFFANAGNPCGGLSREREPTNAEVSACQTSVNAKMGGVIGMVAGSAFFVGGIPLIAVGAAPDDDEPARARLRLDVAPGGGTLTVAF